MSRCLGGGGSERCGLAAVKGVETKVLANKNPRCQGMMMMMMMMMMMDDDDG